MFVRRIFPVVMVFLLLLTTGCGARGIPAIKQEMLDKKISVLMITSPSLSDLAKQTIGATLLQWRDSNSIAFEWMQNLTALDDNLVNKMKTRTYDYIYVIGTDLLPAASQLAKQELSTSKWILMQDTIDVNGSTLTTGEHSAVFQINPELLENMQAQWVNDLLLQNVSVEWVTRVDHPIPSEWAPSEEADHIVLLDNNTQWFQQLSFQTKQHGSKWIIFYAGADAATIQKAKTIGISVMDFSHAYSVELNWEAILANRLNEMTQHSWQGGAISYTEQELKALTMK